MEKKEINMKRTVCLLVMFSVCFFVACTGNSKAATIDYVQKNNMELSQFTEDIISSDGRNDGLTYNGWNVSYWEETGIVEFLVKARGLGSQTSYEGFYFSPDDKPMGFQGAEIEFKEDNAGWRWEESGGDNWNYTERIMENWYWYEMHF